MSEIHAKVLDDLESVLDAHERRYQSEGSIGVRPDDLRRLLSLANVGRSMLEDQDRYRFRTVSYDGRTMMLRDDGYRISFLILSGEGHHQPSAGWVHWADYKQCNLPGPASHIADLLMRASGGTNG